MHSCTSLMVTDLLCVCLMLQLLSHSVGVTHWRLEDGVIKAVRVHTVISPQKVCNTCNDDKEEVTVFDKELTILIRRLYANKQVRIPPNRVNTNTHVTTTTQECPSVVDRSLRVKITSPKNPTSNRCHTVRKTNELSCTEGTSCNSVIQQDKHKVLPPNRDLPTLSCGDPVEFTAYDFLEGVIHRKEHPSHPEPEVIMIFKDSESDKTVDLFKVEETLKIAIQENPFSVAVLNQIGNYWRIKGNTLYAIECFRRALSLNPDHPDILLNLARVLYNQHFINDTIFLTKKSLHVKDPNDNTWLQHYTLGEAYMSLNRYDEAASYFKKALEHNPSLHRAEVYLRDLGRDENHITNAYTILIIVTLVSVVLGIIYYLLCINISKQPSLKKTKRV